MTSDLLDPLFAETGIDWKQLILQAKASEGAMSDDEMSVSDEFGEDGSLSPDESALKKQQASLKIYLDSLPYECESLEEMQTKLEEIVGKIMICAQAKNWLLLTTWDAMLQWFALPL